MEATKMPYAAAMKHYFGLHPGQTLGQFMVELRALSDEEKAWFRDNLSQVGYLVT